MQIDNLYLEQFKNYDQLDLQFDNRITSFVGINGAGKTNIIDAIHYLGLTKSAFGSGELQNIRHGQNHFLIRGDFNSNNDPFEIKAYYERDQKKIIRKNNVDYEKLSDHIGQVLLVMATPYDTDIIRGSGDIRRKWVDGTISMVNKPYLDTLIRFQKTLKQRNALLKQIHLKPTTTQSDLLDTYDEQVINHSLSLAKTRSSFLKDFRPYFISNVELLVSDLEKCDIHYRTHVKKGEFENQMKEVREKDIMMQRTTIGCHRDDFIFSIDEHPIKRFGSQGQQKTFLIAMRFAQFDYLTQANQQKPILLLDDIFDKLDDSRITNLINTLKDDTRFGQVIVTDARKERTKSFFAGYKDLSIVEIENGKIA